MTELEKMQAITLKGKGKGYSGRCGWKGSSDTCLCIVSFKNSKDQSYSVIY